VLTPSLEIGIRHDGRDAETGFGADIGAGLALADPARGISSEIRVRGVLTHEDDDMRARGVSGSLSWDPAPETERGLSLDLTQTFGGSASGAAQTLFGQPVPVEQDIAGETGDELDRQRLDARLGYGFGVFDDRWTAMPALGLGLSDSSREVRLGGRLARRVSAGLDFGIDLEGRRHESEGGSGPEHGLALGFGWRLDGAEGRGLDLRFELSGREAANDNGRPEGAVGLTLAVRW